MYVLFKSVLPVRVSRSSSVYATVRPSLMHYSNLPLKVGRVKRSFMVGSLVSRSRTGLFYYGSSRLIFRAENVDAQSLFAKP